MEIFGDLANVSFSRRTPAQLLHRVEFVEVKDSPDSAGVIPCHSSLETWIVIRSHDVDLLHDAKRPRALCVLDSSARQARFTSRDETDPLRGYATDSVFDLRRARIGAIL